MIKEGMPKWLESVYSDGGKEFVSNPFPNLGETVKIRIRMYKDAPVKHVFVKTVPNGAEYITEAKRKEVKHGLVYYEAKIKIVERRTQYQFYLACEDIIYFYNQKEITTYAPDMTHDFVLLTDYKQPEWVKEAVFYQIFPERFYNGNPENDVKTNEYMFDGHYCTKMENWNDVPLEYNKGFCMDFFGGDLEGVKAKIPYLKELGITAVYLNPIFRAPSIHKYDCIDFFHVDEHFGGDEALAKLSQALHENGMRLILDISINHTGIAHKWFNKEGIFFDKSEGAYNNPQAKERNYYFFEGDSKKYKGWANFSTLPTLNYTSEELRDVIYRAEDSVIRKWLKPPYNIDGWRFDVADVFARNNEIQLAHELWPEIRKSIREENEEAYILAEDWGDCAAYMQGNEWDSPMNYYGCGRVFRQFIGLPELFLLRHPILRKIPYMMTAEDVEQRVLGHLTRMPYALWQNQFNLIDSHDVPRAHNYKQLNRDKYKGAVIMQFALIGTPSIYYGDEVEIKGTVTTTEGCRYPMPWSEDMTEKEMYKFYQTLSLKKRNSKAMKDGGMKFLYAEDKVVAIARFYEEEAVIALMSVNESEIKVTLPVGAIGVERPVGGTDIFGTALRYVKTDENHLEVVVPANGAFLFDCILK